MLNQCEIKYHPRKTNMAANVLNQKSQVEDVRRFMDIDSLLEGMRKLLLGSSQQDEVLALMEDVRVIDYDELKD